jgi:hypothetical protein
MRSKESSLVVHPPRVETEMAQKLTSQVVGANGGGVCQASGAAGKILSALCILFGSFL